MCQTNLDYIIYIVIIITILIVIPIEMGQMSHEYSHSQKNEKDIRTVFYRFLPKKDDTYNVLLDKMYGSSKYFINTIFWRMIILASIVSSFIILYVINQRLPTGYEFLVSIIVTYLVIYLLLSIYEKQFAMPCIHNAERIRNILTRKY